MIFIKKEQFSLSFFLFIQEIDYVNKLGKVHMYLTMVIKSEHLSIYILKDNVFCIVIIVVVI